MIQRDSCMTVRWPVVNIGVQNLVYRSSSASLMTRFLTRKNRFLFKEELDIYVIACAKYNDVCFGLSESVGS